MYRFAYDAGTGLLTCTVHGFWQMADAEGYWRELTSRIDRARREFGRIAYLVDACDYLTQSREVQQYSESRSGILIVSADDRVAIVTGSSLVRMQAKRMVPCEQLRAFGSRAEARQWLGVGGAGDSDPSPKPTGEVVRAATC